MKDVGSKNKGGKSGWIFDRLFQQVPYNIAVIDRDYNIVQANDNFGVYFGDWQGRKCFDVFKNLRKPCPKCPVKQVFKDGRARVRDMDGIDQYGRPAHFVGHYAPLRHKEGGPVDLVVEMSSDVTLGTRWSQEYQILFDRVPCYITVIDENYRIVRANERFRDSFGDVIGQHCYKVYKRRDSKCPGCPAAKTFRDGKLHRSSQTGTGKRGQDIHYVVTTSPLRRGDEKVAHVIEISADVTRLKKLEDEVLEAERLSAVGQTVAGLAHSIKNILMGLEGGKYIVSLGLKKENREMINQGWEMLDRNLEKTTSLVKSFLSFSKGRVPQLQMVDAAALVDEIVELYRDIAAQSGIELRAEYEDSIKKAPLDPDGIHTCLTNLVSNAIDACLMGKQKGSEVVIRVGDRRGSLVFEVTDNGSGIDYEIKKKIFTTFFTTKGGEGTGLGLLTTRKIVQEHGGRINVESKKGQGARFIMEFPRHRLTLLHKRTGAEDASQHQNKEQGDGQ